MNQETNDFLLYNLEEAHNTFISIIREMKDNNIEFNYKELEMMERNSYQYVMDTINKMNYYVSYNDSVKDQQMELLEEKYRLIFKYTSLYVVTLVLIRLYHEIFDTSKLNDMVKYGVGLFLGSCYMGLLNRDINENYSDTKEKRDLINKLKTMKEEYKQDHDKIVFEIDSIFALNSYLWTELDKVKYRKGY